MIPDSFKQDLLNRVDVVDVVQRYVQLRKAGANYVGLCPFHNEKTPSFSVSPTKQFYHCFGCGAHGNAIGLMAYASMGWRRRGEGARLAGRHAGARIASAHAGRGGAQGARARPLRGHGKGDDLLSRRAEEVAARDRVPEKRGSPARSPRATASATRPTTGRPSRRCSNYEDKALAESAWCRAVTRQALRPLPRLHHVPDPERARRGDRLRRPHPRQGRAEVPELAGDPLFEKGRELYGLPQARAMRSAAASRVLVVEGYMDVVALAQFGVGYAVATSAPRPRRSTSRACGSPTSSCSASTAMPPGARRPGARWK